MIINPYEIIKIQTINRFVGKHSQQIVFLFFTLFLIVGLGIYKDYGLSWDEYAQWHDNGYVNFNYIVHHDKAALLAARDRYHGPAFELFLVGIEKLFRLNDTREIFFMRHLLTFVTFFISSLFFYHLAKKIFKNKKIAFIGFLLYFLCPHIFAHSFYNSKDPIFLAFFTISIFLLIRFHEKPTYFNALIYALITAFTIDIRIFGIIIPAISFSLLLIEIIDSINNKIKFTSKIFIYVFYFTLLIPLIILFWPILWIDPIHHFIEALKENSAYPWNGKVLYFGKTDIASDLPWHYVLYWIVISKPILYSVLFVSGTIVLLISFFKQPFNFILKKRNEIICLIWFFLPLMLVLIFKVRVFDTGRHLYFMNGGFVLIALFGLQSLYETLKKRKVVLYSLYLIVFLSLGNVIYSMVKIHPYQNLYFNAFAGRDMDKIKTNFEFDYWGVASREVLEHILLIDSSKHIKIYAENMPGVLNASILTKEQRERLEYTDTLEKANYYMADYRWYKEEDYPYRKDVYSAVIGNAKIGTAFKIRHSEGLYRDVKGKTLMTFSTDFEHIQANWDNNGILQPHCGAHSGLFSAAVDSVIEYSSGLTITNPDYIYNQKNIILKASFWRYNDQADAEATLVVAITRPNGSVYFWAAITHLKDKQNEQKNEWKKMEGAVDLPVINTEQNTIKIYLWNTGKKRIFIDDIKIDFIEEN